MSDERPTSRPFSDGDSRLLDGVDRLGPDGEASERDVTELFGLLPYALDERPVRPEVKQALMGAIESLAPRSAPEPGATASGRLVTLERRTRWFLPLAAALAIALLGIAGLQFRRLEAHQRTIDRLSAELERVDRNGAELAEIRRALAETGDRLRMMTTRGAEFCVLKPVGDDPRFARATATMVIAPDRDEWYLAAEGLAPCDAEVCYQLWFLTEADSIPAASFGAREADRRIELGGSDKVPTGVRGISITHGAGSEPEEPPVTVLFADQAMTLL